MSQTGAGFFVNGIQAQPTSRFRGRQGQYAVFSGIDARHLITPHNLATLYGKLVKNPKGFSAAEFGAHHYM